MEKSLYFNDLQKQKLEKQEEIASHNFKHFLESFDYSSNENSSSPKQKDSVLQDLGNILIEKAHNLCIYHTNSSKKRQSPVFSLDFKENYRETLKENIPQPSENAIFIEEKSSFSQFSQENSGSSKKNSRKTNENSKKKEIWQRLQADRKETQLKREILRQKNEEKQVFSLFS